MATKPLPTIATDSQGRPVKQKDVGAGVLEAVVKSNELMLDIQKVQLDVLTDILGLVKNIADNMFANLTATLPPEAMDLFTAAEKPIEAARGETKNKLAELEKEREAKSGSDQDKPESMFDSLKKLFDDYFGVFKNIFTIIKAVLIPMVLGFVVGFRKKFDLISVAITLAILYPIRVFKLMSRVFGFLYQLLIKLWDGLKFIGNTVKNFIRFAPKLVRSLFNDLGLIFLRIKDAITGSKAFTFITSIFTKIKSFFDVVLKGLQPILKFFNEGRGILSKIFGVLKPLARVLGLPLTILFGIIGGIQGAIKGFKKEGILGGIKGLFAGAIDGAFGWIFDAIGWVFGKLGYKESEKALKEFNLFRLVSEIFDILFMPLKIIAQLSQGKVPDFMKDIWDTLAEAIRSILITLGETLPGGDWLLNKLGIKENKEAQGRKAAPQAFMDEQTRKEWDAIDTGNEQLDNLARSALEVGNREVYEELTGQGLFDVEEGTESAKKLMMESGGYTAEQVENIAQTGYMLRGVSQAPSQPTPPTPPPTPKPIPVPPQDKAALIGQATQEVNKAKLPIPPETTKPSVINFDARNYSKSTAQINRELRADTMGLGSRGSAASPNVWNWKPQ